MPPREIPTILAYTVIDTLLLGTTMSGDIIQLAKLHRKQLHPTKKPAVKPLRPERPPAPRPAEGDNTSGARPQ